MAEGGMSEAARKGMIKRSDKMALLCESQSGREYKPAPRRPCSEC